MTFDYAMFKGLVTPKIKPKISSCGGNINKSGKFDNITNRQRCIMTAQIGAKLRHIMTAADLIASGRHIVMTSQTDTFPTSGIMASHERIFISAK